MQPDIEAPDTVSPSLATRRRRLWQLPATSHAPLIGLGLAPAELRRLTDRLFRGRNEFDDARLLAAVVKECATRNKVSEALQRTFDTRFAHTLGAFRGVRSAEALAALWQDCLAAGNVGAGLWSASTHAWADEALLERLGHDVQMLQFHAVSVMGAERRQVDALLLENGVLTREMARIQQRQTRWHVERREEQAELAALRLELIRARAGLAERDRPVRADPPCVRAGDDGRSSDGTAKRPSGDATPTWSPPEQPAERTIDAAQAVAPPTDAGSALPDVTSERSLIDAAGAARRILCVGGRTGHVPIYRALVEEQGGRFLHHDGGVEDNPRRLDAQLSAADLVICQTGCLSHNAYWRVKDHCKRTGTPCVYLDKPGAGSFLRGLVRAVPPTEPAVAGAAERPA